MEARLKIRLSCPYRRGEHAKQGWKKARSICGHRRILSAVSQDRPATAYPIKQGPYVGQARQAMLRLVPNTTIASTPSPFSMTMGNARHFHWSKGLRGLYSCLPCVGLCIAKDINSVT